MLKSSGAFARVSNNKVDPERGLLTIKTGRTILSRNRRSATAEKLKEIIRLRELGMPCSGGNQFAKLGLRDGVSENESLQ